MALILKVFALTVVLLVFLHSGADSLSRDDFPNDFVFGASTSAYQVPLSLSPFLVFSALAIPFFTSDHYNTEILISSLY